MDHVYKVDHFTVPGETQGCLEYDIKCGGKGVNQAIAMAFAGNDTYFAGIIGSDSGLLKDALVDKGVHIDYMKISNKPTGHAIIEVDQSGQNHILLNISMRYFLIFQRVILLYYKMKSIMFLIS